MSQQDKTVELANLVDIPQMRLQLLEKCKVVFGQLFDVIRDLDELTHEHIDDPLLSALVVMLRRTSCRLLDTVTCKILINGAIIEMHIEDYKEMPQGESDE